MKGVLVDSNVIIDQPDLIYRILAAVANGHPQEPRVKAAHVPRPGRLR